VDCRLEVPYQPLWRLLAQLLALVMEGIKDEAWQRVPQKNFRLVTLRLLQRHWRFTLTALFTIVSNLNCKIGCFIV
jgi:hypothetical protein